MSAKHLTQEQAASAYAAMCALNTSGGRLRCAVFDAVRVNEFESGNIAIEEAQMQGWHIVEQHASQVAFALAYELHKG